MPTKIENFWRDAPSENPPLTDEMVAKAEAILGLKLPQLFIDLLKIKNGGYSQGFVFPTKNATSWADDHAPFESMYGISFDEDGLSIMESAYLKEEWDMPEKQVVISGDGSWFITLDYRKSEIPTVCWIDNDDEEDVLLAPNFDDFIKKLVSDEDFDFED